MPLHVAENHDGQLTGQKGVHVYFESILVDQLDPQLKVDVMARALKDYDKSEMAKMGSDEAVRWIISDSFSRIDELLKIDKQTDRKNLKLASEKFKDLIVARIAQGAILTAVVWAEILKGVEGFEEDHYHFFDGKPAYVFPGKEL
jgi:hypothetical protein